jgi:hypothetical protein
MDESLEEHFESFKEIFSNVISAILSNFTNQAELVNLIDIWFKKA